MEIRAEQMSPVFTKFHLDGPWPFSAVMHRFSEPDAGDPHDHPWSFRSYILHGGYIEQIYDASGKSRDVFRKPGDSLFNAAGHIHRIIDLPYGECWTLIQPFKLERKPGFYQFREDGVYHRFWDQAEFQPYKPGG